MLNVFLERTRARLGMPARIAALVAAVALCYVVALLGAGVPGIEVVLVAIVALTAALVGFPIGAIAATGAAVAEYVGRQGIHHGSWAASREVAFSQS